jgi:hypothetical protein
MRNLYVEQRTLTTKDALSWDIAHHLATRQLGGTIVVITDKPVALRASVSKQWQKVIRQVQSARSSTLNAPRIFELTRHLSHMQSLRMTTGIEKSADHTARVQFATLEDMLATPPICHTLYITVAVSDEDAKELTAQMPAGSLLVRY